MNKETEGWQGLGRRPEVTGPKCKLQPQGLKPARSVTTYPVSASRAFARLCASGSLRVLCCYLCVPTTTTSNTHCIPVPAMEDT